jgi:hypothetical protein
MLAHLGVQKLSPFLELLLVDFAARKALRETEDYRRGVASSGIAASTKRAFLLGISGEQH